MKRLCFYLFILAGILFLAGCTPRGLLYTHINPTTQLKLVLS